MLNSASPPALITLILYELNTQYTQNDMRRPLLVFEVLNPI